MRVSHARRRVNKISIPAAIILLLPLALEAIAASAPIDPGHPESVLEVETLEQVATGFQFTEGPVWHPEGFLLFTDIPANRILKWTPGKAVEVYREPSFQANGLAFDRQGRLLACEHESRKVTRTGSDGEVVVLAERFGGKRLNSPNDLVVGGNGDLYFTDPPYGVEEEKRELDFQGVYRLDPQGVLHLESKIFLRPNGIGLSPDGKTLYLADTKREGMVSFPVREDGGLGEPRDFGRPGLLGGDGLAVDSAGNVYATGKGGVWIYDSQGNWIGLLKTPEGPANCAFGGPDRKDFYITAVTSLYRVRCKHPGLGPVIR